MRALLCAVLLLIASTLPQPLAGQGIGQWRDHFSFNTAHRIALAPSRVYAAYGQAVGYYDASEGTIVRLTKVNQLSDAGIATLAYDNATKSLVVAYTNSNIDIVREGVTYNISDLKRNTATGDKSIYNIRFDKRHAYVACGIGILILDLERAEIETSCAVGKGGTTLPVYDLVFCGGRLYAATREGIISIDRNSRFPNIADLWERDTTSSLAGRQLTLLESDGRGLLTLSETPDPLVRTLYRYDGAGDYTPLAEGDIRSVHCADGYTTVTYRDSVVLFNDTFGVNAVYKKFAWGELILNDAVRASDGTMWVAHDWAGLVRLARDGRLETFNPKGNVSDNVYHLTAFDDVTYLCPGGKSSTYANRWINGNLFNHRKHEWNQLNRNGADTLVDFLCASVNPTDPSQIAVAAWGAGIVDVRDGRIAEVFNEGNSDGAIQAYRSGGYRHVRIGSVCYDRDGNLWAINSLVNNGLIEHRNDGSWHAYETRSLVGENELDQILCDSLTGYKWFYGKPNVLYVHDGVSRRAYVDPNNGSRLETSRINCVVQDRSGDLWIGTNKGIKVIFDAYNAFANGGGGEKAPVVCSNIIISEGEIVEYLMAYENVSCIAVDGANRKWVGTENNGLYLLSATGLKELHHFTAANSPLPSDKIVALTVQPITGEVFVGTDHGTVGYRGTATFGTAQPLDDIHVFPNPVRPDYDGPIGISGFTNNALVHVTDAAGHVVYTTQAEGGQAVWYGRTNSGERVGSGVYYVFASDAEGGNRSVAKVLVVR